MIAYKIFCFIVIISIVVVIHELGHYLLARFCDVKVKIFSVGFGKKLFGKKDKHGTEWQVCALPLGGYVQMNGDENPASLNAADEAKLDKTDKTAFYNKNLKQKFAIVFAGPFFNYILAFVLYLAVAFFYGASFTPNIIDKVAEKSPAALGGLLSGDKIIEINGKHVDDFMTVRSEIMLSTGEVINMKIARNGKIQSLQIKPEIKESADRKKTKTKFIGISAAQQEFKKQSFSEACKYAILEPYRISVTSLRALWQIITGDRSARELGGPIKIAVHSADAVNMGIIGMILFTAFISVNLGLVNLLPIPLLDGGHLFFYIVEGTIGRPLPKILYKGLLYVGMVILGGLMCFTLINDFIGLIGK